MNSNMLTTEHRGNSIANPVIEIENNLIHRILCTQWRSDRLTSVLVEGGCILYIGTTAGLTGKLKNFKHKL